MAIYNLEDNEDIYIAPRYYGSKFHFHLTRISSEINRNNIRTIDLRTDKLMVYGTEIKQSKLDRLHECLVLRPKSGIVFVNCNGAIYFYVPGKGCYRPIQNNIFDWSHFGVLVPNSAQQNETNQKGVDEIDALKEQLSACQKDKQEVEMKLQKVCNQLSSVDFELENHKIELETVKKMAKDLENQLSMSRKESKKKEEELDASKNKITQLEEQLSVVKRDNEDKKTELHNVQEQLLTSNFELEMAKTQLDSSNMRVKELENELFSSKKERADMEQELQNVRNQVSAVNSELESTKTSLESSKKRVEELEEKLTIYENVGKITKMELERVQGDLSLARDELQSSKNKLEAYKRQVQELKEKSCGSKAVIDQLMLIDSEVKSTNQKLDQLLVSMMWNEHDQSCHPHRSLPSPSSLDKLAISIPIEEV